MEWPGIAAGYRNATGSAIPMLRGCRDFFGRPLFSATQRPSPLPLRVDFDMEMDEVVDEVFAEEAEEFAGSVVAAVVGEVEFELARAGEALAVLGCDRREGS